jgi:hypothetical protein
MSRSHLEDYTCLLIPFRSKNNCTGTCRGLRQYDPVTPRISPSISNFYPGKFQRRIGKYRNMGNIVICTLYSNKISFYTFYTIVAAARNSPLPRLGDNLSSSILPPSSVFEICSQFGAQLILNLNLRTA